MANIQWNNQAFSPVKFDPSKGFAAAADSFGNIADQMQDKREAESLAATNAAKLQLLRDAQAYEQETPARELALASEKGVLANEISQGAGGSRSDKLFENLLATEDPRLQEVTGLMAGQTGPMKESGYQAFDQYVADNKAAVSDPATYRQQIMSEMGATGKFSGPEMNAEADAATSRLFPTMDKDLQKTLITAIGKPAARAAGGGSGGGTGGSGTMQNIFGTQTPGGRAAVVDRIVKNRGLPQTHDTIFGVRTNFPGTNMDPGGDDLDQVLGRMASDGITSSTAGEAALMKAMDGKTVKDGFNWNTDEGYTKLHEFAKKVQDKEIRQRNSKTGREASSTAMGEQAARNDYFGRIDQVLQRGTTAKLSDDELVQNFLSGLGAEAPAPAAVVPPQAAPQAAPVVAPPQQAAQAGIMPPAQVVPPVAAPAPVVNNLGVDPASIPQSEGGKLFDTIVGTAQEAPRIVAEGLQKGLSFIQDAKNKSYAKQTAIVTDAIKNSGNLDGISSRDIKVALADSKLSATEKDVIRKLSKIRTR